MISKLIMVALTVVTILTTIAMISIMTVTFGEERLIEFILRWPPKKRETNESNLCLQLHEHCYVSMKACHDAC